ncbi:MAG TPA: Hsp20/alpha crystallin family protein [Mycobacteriales bacterium]|jgi:HSP20 family protein|nr:Hsp20/alpha crystallin family protein [Mycobacteriales bacterium]
MLLERFDPFLAEFDRLAQRTLGAGGAAGLPMDVIRRGEELVVRVDLPGVAGDKIDVTVENQVLTISAERRADYAEGDHILVQERFDGVISRRLRMPDWVDADTVTADYVDGVLTVHLPLADKAKPRRVQVNAAEPANQLES